MNAAVDTADRPLGVDELAELAELAAALRVWSSYLDRAGFYATLPEAQRHSAAVELRDHGDPDPAQGVRLAVSPVAAHEWSQHYGGDETGRRGVEVTLHLLVAALEFMGSRPLTTFRPVGEHPPAFPRCRRVDGWWVLTREMQRRIGFRRYTPVLTRPSGRPRGPEMSGPPVSTSATRLKVVPGDVVSVWNLLAHYARTVPRTALLEVASRLGHALCPRRRGGPYGAGSVVLAVHTEVVLVHVLTLVAHARASAGLLGLTEVSAVAVREALVAAAAADPGGGLVEAPRFATYDAGWLRGQRDWWRVPLHRVGAAATDPVELVGEWSAWRHGGPAGRVGARIDVGGGAEAVHLGADGTHYYEDERKAMGSARRAELGLSYEEETST